MAHFNHHPHRSPTHSQPNHRSGHHHPNDEYAPSGHQYRAYNTPAGHSDDEETMNTNAPIFNYNPGAQNKSRRLPAIGIEHGYDQPSEYPSPQTAIRANNYNAPYTGNYRPYAPPSPSPRSPTERQSYVEHPGKRTGFK